MSSRSLSTTHSTRYPAFKRLPTTLKRRKRTPTRTKQNMIPSEKHEEERLRLCCTATSSSDGERENDRRPTAKEWIATWRTKQQQQQHQSTGFHVDTVKDLSVSIVKTTAAVSTLIVMDKAVFASLASCLKLTWLPSPLLGMFIIFGGLYAGQVRLHTS